MSFFSFSLSTFLFSEARVDWVLCELLFLFFVYYNLFFSCRQGLFCGDTDISWLELNGFILGRNRGAGFSIFCVRTVRVHSVCSCRTNGMDFDRLCLLEVLDVSSPISDRAFANSRTPDTGNAGGLILRQPR